jgi:hypothetical protein
VFEPLLDHLERLSLSDLAVSELANSPELTRASV